MTNTVTVSIHFSFKGKKYAPSITLELDKYLISSGKIPDLCPLIANQNNFDLYSYEYEMMQAAEIVFSDAKGLINQFITDGQLDVGAFQTAWQEDHIESELLNIAKNHMNINDFTAHPPLKNALQAAYRLGKRDSDPEFI